MILQIPLLGTNVSVVIAPACTLALTLTLTQASGRALAFV